MVFYVNKCKVKIEYPFLLLLSFAVLLKAEELPYILLFSALHEAGHIIILYLLGGRIDEITVSFYGIGLKHSSALTMSREIMFLSGGIGVNLLFVLLNIKREINLLLLIFNVLPLYPLDGGRIVKLLFGLKEKYFTYFSVLFIIIILIFAIFIKNISLILIAIYILFFLFNEVIK